MPRGTRPRKPGWYWMDDCRDIGDPYAVQLSDTGRGLVDGMWLTDDHAYIKGNRFAGPIPTPREE